MAHYQHLPIYTSAFQLLKEFYLCVPKMSKQYKYTLGASMLAATMEVVRIIVKTNSVPVAERGALLDELIWKIEEIVIMLRIAEALKQFDSDRQYLYMVEQVVGCARQAEGWRKSCSVRTVPAQNKATAQALF